MAGPVRAAQALADAGDAVALPTALGEDAAGIAAARHIAAGKTQEEVVRYAEDFFHVNLGPVDPAHTTLHVTLPTNEAGGGTLDSIVKLTLFLTDLSKFASANSIMADIIPQPFPARSTIGVASLPKGAQFEVEAIIVV